MCPQQDPLFHDFAASHLLQESYKLLHVLVRTGQILVVPALAGLHHADAIALSVARVAAHAAGRSPSRSRSCRSRSHFPFSQGRTPVTTVLSLQRPVTCILEREMLTIGNGPQVGSPSGKPQRREVATMFNAVFGITIGGGTSQREGGMSLLARHWQSARCGLLVRSHLRLAALSLHSARIMADLFRTHDLGP